MKPTDRDPTTHYRNEGEGRGVMKFSLHTHYIHTHMYLVSERRGVTSSNPQFLSHLSGIFFKTVLSADHLISCTWIRRTRVEGWLFSSWTSFIKLLMTYEAR
jgi:hypothetical protein